MTSLMAQLAAEARALGFVLAGAAPLDASPRGDFVRHWLADGRAGEMTWLMRRVDERLDPRVRYPWARSVVMLAWPYPAPPGPAADWRTTLTGRVAAYAAGRDYHDVVRGRMGTLVQRLRRHAPGAQFHRYVDTGPLLERELGSRAGLGWIGRNTLVLHRLVGSYVLLGTLLTSLEIEPAPPPTDHCGTCTRCIAACPTDALAGDYTMDPRRCISYLTIEHRGAIPAALRPALGNWVFGCDVCQEVCPWNAEARPRIEDTAWLQPSLVELLHLDAAGFQRRFSHTALFRATRDGLVRNAAVALGNSGNPAAVPALRTALDDGAAIVRAHAVWALGRIGGTAARRAVEAHARRETDPAARAEVAHVLAGDRGTSGPPS